MDTRTRAMEIYNKHLALASANGRSFRKTVMDELMAEMGVTLASSATHYNNCKKSVPVEGLGRAPISKGVRKAASKGKDKTFVHDNECFTVIELLPAENGTPHVGRCQSFLLQGDASEKFDEKIEAWPALSWVMIQGLGPNSGESFKLGAGEKEIKRFAPKKEEATA